MTWLTCYISHDFQIIKSLFSFTYACHFIIEDASRARAKDVLVLILLKGVLFTRSILDHLIPLLKIFYNYVFFTCHAFSIKLRIFY